MKNKPELDEYDPFYQGYIDALPDANIMEILHHQLNEVDQLISNLDTQSLAHRYHDDKWTVAEVLGHILDVERLMSYRAMCIARNEKQLLPGFDQNEYVINGNFENRTAASLRGEFINLRKANIDLYHSFTESDLLKKGIASGVVFTVKSLMFITAGHVAHHLKILSTKYSRA